MKEAVTKVIDTLTQEDFHWTFQKLLERYNKCIAPGGDYFEGDESFMRVLSIKVPIRKKSGNLFNDPRTSVYWGTEAPDDVLQKLLHFVKCTTRVAISKHGIIGSLWFENADEEAVTMSKRRYIYFPGLLARLSGIRVGWGIETNGRFEAERPPSSVGPPSGERAAFLSPMHPLYSTRSLVQARFRSVIQLDSLDPHCTSWVND